jgi:ATP-binding cassette subfamily B protein
MKVGEIISRVNDAVKIRSFINETALNIVVNLMIVGLSMACMFLYYWKLAVLSACIVPLYLVIYLVSNKVNKLWQRRLMEKSAGLETQLVESLGAASTIKRFCLEGYASEKTERSFIGLLRSIYHSSRYNIFLSSTTELATKIFTIRCIVGG